MARLFVNGLAGNGAARLSIGDHARCAVAILAACGQRLPLAIHIYVALMNGISPAEIAHILGLAGSYGGADSGATGFATGITTLETLQRLIRSDAPRRAIDVYGALRAALPG
jgi:hypothetical protein